MRFEVIASVDQAGILEYWTGAKTDYKFPAKLVSFESKLDTGNLMLNTANSHFYSDNLFQYFNSYLYLIKFCDFISIV